MNKTTNFPKEESSIRKMFEEANEHRDYTVYTRLMDAALEAKAASIFPHFNVEEGDVIVDAGSGTGALSELAAEEFHGAHVYALDLSHELQFKANADKALAKLVYGDASKKIFPDNSVTVKFYSTSGHEIESFGGAGKMQEALRSTLTELKPGGRIVVRDFAKPSLREPVYMEILSHSGQDNVSEETGEINYDVLSTRALFDRFYLEFRGGNAFSYEMVIIDGHEYIKLDPEWAHEFYLRKDYTANWRQEIKEKYTYWSKEEALLYLENAGYVNGRVIPDPNEYILNNRLIGKIGLHVMEDGVLRPISFPATHMVVIGEKPVIQGAEQVSVSLPEAVDYQKLLNTIKINEEEHTVTIDDNVFFVESIKPLIGAKKMVFKIKGEKRVLKLVRPDTHNHHNSFKALFQTIERERVLEEYGVLHPKVIDKDPLGPPYRYLVQEEVAEGSMSIAELILRNELREDDVRAIAEIVNKSEKGKFWQLDTNPHNWHKVTNEDGSSSLVYVDGKVYRYDELWAFRRVGLLQWINPTFIKNGRPLSADIPKETDFKDLQKRWEQGGCVLDIWKKYLDPSVAP
jgi:ubiquinone/menaquinone biosynthesis C-methylase UbiE